MKALVVGIAVWICLLDFAPADTFTVTNTQDTGAGSFREALLAANGNAGPDQITFSVTGVITSQLPSITDDVTITGPGASNLTVSGGTAITAEKIVQISNLTFDNGQAPASANARIINHGILTVSHCVFSNNATFNGFGGAIFNDGNLVLIDTTFSSNKVTSGGGSGAFGGAVYSAAGSVTVMRCTFMANSVPGGFGSAGSVWIPGGAASGSALFLAAGSGSITFSKFLQNTATGGSGGTNYNTIDPNANGSSGGAASGALYVKAGSFVIEDSTFAGNAANGGSGGNPGGSGGGASGGAIANFGGSLQVTRCTIASNRASGGRGGSEAARLPSHGGAASGGGMVCLGGTLTVSNSTFTGNKAFGGDAINSFVNSGTPGVARGGGFASTGGNSRLTNCTIAGNQVQPGLRYPSQFSIPPGTVTAGQAFGGGFYSSAPTSLGNDLFSGNAGSGTVTSLGHNLFSTDAGVTGLVASDIRNVAAPLGTLRDNGGPTQTMALPGGSPAINAGDNGGAPATDQRGLTRPHGANVDIGAYEFTVLAILADGAEVPTTSLIRDAPVTVSFQAGFPTGAILYTLDGSTPTLSSTLYTAPFLVTDSATIRAIAYSSNFSSSVTAGPLEFIRNIPRTLFVAATGPGTVTVDPLNVGPYLDGAVVTLTATPAAGYMLQAWSGDLSGNESPVTLTMNADRFVNANFVPTATYTLSVVKAGEGTVTLDPPGGTYLVNTTVSLTATPAAGWMFQGWSGAISGSTSPATLLMTGNRSVTATFVPIPRYTLSITQTGEGMVQLTPPAADYLPNSVVSVEPIPAAGWIFSGWSGDVNGTDSPLEVMMNANKALHATFTKIFWLTATTRGGGTVNVNPLAEYYTIGTVVNVAANADAGWQFLRWSGDLDNTSASNDIQMVVRSRNVEAIFGTPLNVGVVGNGAVTRHPDLPLYPAQSFVRLTAVPAIGNYFAFWSNPIGSSVNPLDLKITSANPTFFAVFSPLAQNESALTVLVDGMGSVSVTPPGTHFTNGTTVQLLAQPAFGQSFLGWSGDASGGNAALSVLVDSSKVITARFTKQPEVSVTADIALIRNEGARLVLRGEVGSTYQILAAQTLTSEYVPVGLATNTLGVVHFLDTEATVLDQRFYRVLVLP